MESAILQAAAVRYAALGWQVFPLSKKSKVPRKSWAEWQNKTSDDEETVFDFWEDFPGSNIAVKLGPDSGIIDIECDSEDGEKWLVEMFGGAENMPVTPTFQSRSGKHRLFKFDSELPNSNKGHWKPKTADGKKQAVDFKVGGGGNGTYSVFPPSIHPDTGEPYKWLIHPDDVDPAPLSEEFILNLNTALYGEDLFSNPAHSGKPAAHWEEIAAGVGEGDRNNTAAEYIGKMLSTMADPYRADAVATVYLGIKGWNALNRPPLDEAELKRTFDSILRRHRESWTNEREREGVEQFGSLNPETGQKSDTPWRLVKVLSEPITWKLYSPLWEHKAPGGCVVLTSADMGNLSSLMREVLEQAGVYLSRRWFPSMWDGTKTGTDEQKRGLASRLVDNCETEEAPPEVRRSYMIAEKVYEMTLRVEYDEDRDAPDARGRMIRRKDGSIWFKVSALLENLQHLAEPVKSGELSKLLQNVEAVDKQARPEGQNSPQRFKVFTKKSLEKLRDMSLFCLNFTGIEEETPKRDALHAEV